MLFHFWACALQYRHNITTGGYNNLLLPPGEKTYRAFLFLLHYLPCKTHIVYIHAKLLEKKLYPTMLL